MKLNKEDPVTVMCAGNAVTTRVHDIYGKNFECQIGNSQGYSYEIGFRIEDEGITWARGWSEDISAALRAANALSTVNAPVFMPSTLDLPFDMNMLPPVKL